MPWNPVQYLAFGNERLRPALELLARVALASPATIVDLGCGAGNVTRFLRERWPDAVILGVDNSREMLAKAAEAPGIAWECADLNDWSPPASVDLVYSNAVLHWLDNHAALFPRLAGYVKPGGVLAIQMPNNFAAPSHTCAFRAARNGPWEARLEGLLRPTPVLARSAYYDLLAPLARRVDIWETEYLQVLEGENPVAEWTRGSLLVPLLQALQEPERSAFETEYRRRVKEAYPPGADGKTLFPFKRLFIVAEF